MCNRVVAVSSKIVAEQKEKSGNALFIRLPRLVAAIQTPYRSSYFLWLSRFLLSETAYSRLFLFIIFSFQNFRYHSGITNGYQCSYWYYDSDEKDFQYIFNLIPKDKQHSANSRYAFICITFSLFLVSITIYPDNYF